MARVGTKARARIQATLVVRVRTTTRAELRAIVMVMIKARASQFKWQGCGS